ncbi:MAG: hypothetical protein CVU49_04320 [Candidatus Cloacimonetes bacterium HGW-Cloacimonetes-2]|jgi:chromosome segregation ATPase|nr:MAG: hypothetical protein CVU49_04320 [Candidatus Cloacimonetes bacterium HGW-Cloacimonetes-2]
MENYAVNLQDKIQKLIDQYTTIKKKLEELQEENNLLTEQNLQLIQQIEDHTKQGQDAGQKVTDMERSIAELEKENVELKKALAGFESVATDALSKLDDIFPDLESL